uniref:AraC family transcriptional regulator n=1 Tax=Roseihalotalea indica TaxID=2867963 RepID=A0AA49GLX8_9BACT|nr:AraC family transcriptional regulator [Tunicatimonas sp. TK19036]
MKAHFEKVLTSPDSSFRAFRYENKEFDAPWHFHPEYELTYILSSRGMRYVGDSVKRFKEGDLVLLGANLPHCWKNTCKQDDLARSVVIQWQDDMLGEGGMDKREFVHIKRLLSTANRGLRFGEKEAAGVREAMINLVTQSPFQRLLSLLQMLDKLARSQYEVLSGSNFIQQTRFETNERVNKIYNYVAENYRQKILLQEMASQVAMSEEAFCRFCKKVLHKPFFVFLNEFKINQACELLIETDMPVAQVGYTCGYESLPFYYRQFKKFMHSSPAAYRKKYRFHLEQANAGVATGPAAR